MTSISDTNVVNAPGGLVLVAEGTRTSSVSTGGPFGSAPDIFSSNITFVADGSQYLIEFFCGLVVNTNVSTQYFALTNGAGTDIGTWGLLTLNAGYGAPIHLRRVYTPAAGVITLNMRAYPDAGTLTLAGGTFGTGTSGRPPITFRVFKILQASQLIVQTPNAPLVTSLPSNAIDGQEVRYLADNTNGIVWNFRYRAGSSSSYKWEFIGGTELNATGNGSQTTSNSFQTSNIPSIILPLAGDYIVEFGGFAQNAASGTTDAIFGLHLNSVAQSYAVSTGTTTYDGASVSRIYRLNSVTGNSTLDVRYRSSLSVNVAFNNIWLNVRPIRVSA